MTTPPTTPPPPPDRWTLVSPIPLDYSLDQLMGQTSTEPVREPRGLVERLSVVSHTPLGWLDPGQLRLAISQREGVQWVLPLALPHLVVNPLADVDLYPGVLLHGVLHLDERFFRANPGLIVLVLRLIARVRLAAQVPEPWLVETLEQERGTDARWFIETENGWRPRPWRWSPWDGFDWEGHWRIPDLLPLERSLDQIEGRPGWWPKRPEGEMHRALDRASATPIGELGLDQVELLLRHQEGVPWLLPRALQAVGADPLTRAGEQAGDLLEALAALQLPELWRVHSLGAGIVSGALARVEERALGVGSDAVALALLERLERRGLWPWSPP